MSRKWEKIIILFKKHENLNKIKNLSHYLNKNICFVSILYKIKQNIDSWYLWLEEDSKVMTYNFKLLLEIIE